MKSVRQQLRSLHRSTHKAEIADGDMWAILTAAADTVIELKSRLDRLEAIVDRLAEKVDRERR